MLGTFGNDCRALPYFQNMAVWSCAVGAGLRWSTAVLPYFYRQRDLIPLSFCVDACVQGLGSIPACAIRLAQTCSQCPPVAPLNTSVGLGNTGYSADTHIPVGISFPIRSGYNESLVFTGLSLCLGLAVCLPAWHIVIHTRPLLLHSDTCKIAAVRQSMAYNARHHCKLPLPYL